MGGRVGGLVFVGDVGWLSVRAESGAAVWALGLVGAAFCGCGVAGGAAAGRTAAVGPVGGGAF